MFQREGRIFTVAPDGQSLSQLTTTGYAWFPTWLDGGRTISYFESDSTEAVNAIRMNADGSAKQPFKVGDYHYLMVFGQRP